MHQTTVGPSAEAWYAFVGAIVVLENLWLWGNHLTGAIPTWLGDRTDLRILSLGGNSLTGAAQ